VRHRWSGSRGSRALRKSVARENWPESTTIRAHDAARLRRLDQQRAGTHADPIGTRVQQVYFLIVAREKRDDTARIFGDRHLARLQDHICDKPAVFLDGVQYRVCNIGRKVNGRKGAENTSAIASASRAVARRRVNSMAVRL
jgi:hypothetical protein